MVGCIPHWYCNWSYIAPDDSSWFTGPCSCCKLCNLLSHFAVISERHFSCIHAFCRFSARTGLYTTTSILEHTDMRCQSLRSMISLGRYASKHESLIQCSVYFCCYVIQIQYDSQDNKDVLKLVFGKHNLTSPISLYSRPEVITKSQSYFFTHSVKTITVTSTAKGITSKQLLIGTVGDQVGWNLWTCWAISPFFFVAIWQGGGEGGCVGDGCWDTTNFLLYTLNVAKPFAGFGSW